MTLDLTPTQQIYLDRLCEGWNCEQIAHNLGVSNKTVSSQLAYARERNDISTTHHLCALWTREKLFNGALYKYRGE